MVWDYDYNDGQDFLDDGTIFILDENDEIVKTIDPAWAKDRDGNYIETYYTIEGNILVQHISFDKNTKFPVVADPTEGDTKTVTKYLKKSRVKSIRDNYAGKPASDFWEDVMNLIGGLVPGLDKAWTIATFLGSRISATKYNTWNKLYTQFPADKNRLKMVLKYRWHHKGAWVAAGAAKYSYVNLV